MLQWSAGTNDTFSSMILDLILNNTTIQQYKKIIKNFLHLKELFIRKDGNFNFNLCMLFFLLKSI